ncbi:MAG: hypothetical protein ABWK01_09420 [Infirmifilum sp.]
MRRSKIGRFEVMALLQAARYYVLTGDKEKAFSFGLNRAIFYAWAKKRGVPVAASRGRAEKSPAQETPTRNIVQVGDEAAYISPNGWFTIGGEEQRPEDFYREVSRKLSDYMNFEEIWRIAVDYVSSFDRGTLLSQKDFYEKVYLPVRDSFPENIEKRGTKQKTLF